MSIRDDFKEYWDGNGLIAPNPGTWTVGQKGSDNGPCFTSEYYAILEKNGQLVDQDKLDFAQKIGQCVNPEGMLCRVPVGQNDGQEQVDDYHGTLNACKLLGNTSIPRQFLKAMFKCLGFMDNVNPGSHTNWAAFMFRQPQLFACMVAASFPSWKNPLHILVRFAFLPFFLYGAVSIAISCVSAAYSDTDSRRLSWHLQSCLKSVSPLCWLASMIWRKRLYKTFYGGMKTIASMYYWPQPDNPFGKWWIT